jgi:hypothetical protein
MARTAAQQRKYMADFRARKRLEQQQSAGLVDPQPVAQPVAAKPWRSAESFAAAKAPAPVIDVHAVCKAAERASWKREQEARADYQAMLGILRTIATAKEQAPGSRRYLVYEDTMSAILAITDDVHERERQAAEFAVDMSEPF